VKEFCLEIICASNKVDNVEAMASQERKWQEAYEDDRYSESFETLDDRGKKMENKIDRILNVIDGRGITVKKEKKEEGRESETKRNQMIGSVSILPINDNSPSDGGFKELFEMLKKISKKQESMDRNMNSIDQQMQSQKEAIAKQIKESIDQQMRSQKESIDQQMQSQKEAIAKQIKESIDQQMRSQKESIDQQMNSQKESICEQNRGIIKLSNQMNLQKESIEEQNKVMNELADQMVKIKNNLKTAKAGKSSEDQT